jgi:hypothetical protein
MRTLRRCAVLAVGWAAVPAPATAQERPPIIDMHMHAHHPTEIPAGAPALCRPEPCRSRGGTATASGAEALQETLAQMRRYNIVTGFLSAPDLDELGRWATAAPDRFILSPFIVEPGRPSPEALRRAYAAGRFGGMGEIATQLSGVAPNDPALAPYFALAEELDVPVLIHAEGIGPYLPGFRSAKGNPLLLEEVLVRHRHLRIYVENTGYPYLGEMIAMMYQYPQLYGDLSTITWVIPRPAFYAYLRALIDAGLGKRLMFGTDQMRWPEAIGWAVEAIEEAPFLSEEQKRDIFYHNAVRFLDKNREPRTSPF